ncbi:hypothetical protein HK105_204660 [Polyrhizophydium stewartii]|uniref:Uncharacterized protein n=1 Tax=Polyrhizophydium stewartii TaxID=2732419 RepID=A0ABR4N877_9FUNG
MARREERSAWFSSKPQLVELQAHEHGISCMQASQDLELLFTGSWDGKDARSALDNGDEAAENTKSPAFVFASAAMRIRAGPTAELDGDYDSSRGDDAKFVCELEGHGGYFTSLE